MCKKILSVLLVLCLLFGIGAVSVPCVATTDSGATVYEIDFTDILNGNNYPNFYGVVYNASGKSVEFSFDYYLPNEAPHSMVHSVSYGDAFLDDTTGSQVLQQGVHHFSYSNPAYPKSNFAPGIQLYGSDLQTVYVWNFSISINGVEQSFQPKCDARVNNILYSQVPFPSAPALAIDYNNLKSANDYPNAYWVVYGTSGKSVSVEFDYYLPNEAPQSMVHCVSTGTNFPDRASGSNVLQQGAHHFSYSNSSYGNNIFAPGIQLYGSDIQTLYIWNLEIKVDGEIKETSPLGEPTVTNITYDDIPFPGKPASGGIGSVVGTTVTMKEQNGYEYSNGGEIFQSANVFEDLEYDTVYTFYSRKSGETEIGNGTIVLIPSAPRFLLAGSTKIFVERKPNYEYSVDGEKWYRNAELTMLKPNTEYTVYCRYALKDNVFPVISSGTVCGTYGKDFLDGTEAENLLYIKDKILAEKADCASDVTGDLAVDVRDLVRYKKMLVIDTAPVIACWGDSVTEGMGMSAGNSYPAQLEKMLASRFQVKNSGDGGENTLTIMARQGALKLYTERDITFASGTTSVVIGDFGDNGFVSATGEKIGLTSALGRELPINDVTIGTENYTVGFKNNVFNWSPISYELTLTRKNTADTLTIPAGTPVVFNNSDIAANDYCEIYFMGANGGYDNNVEKLIEQYQALVDYHHNNRYLIIVPYWTSAYDNAFAEAFGDHAVNFRKLAISEGLSFEGLTATTADTNSMAGGSLPPSLCYQNKLDVHLNANGYHYLAHVLFERGKLLGYW